MNNDYSDEHICKLIIPVVKTDNNNASYNTSNYDTDKKNYMLIKIILIAMMIKIEIKNNNMVIMMAISVVMKAVL